mgnify:CR=1 FL=1
MNKFKFKDGELATLQALVGEKVGELKHRTSSLSEKISLNRVRTEEQQNELVEFYNNAEKRMKEYSDLWVYLTEGRRKQEDIYQRKKNLVHLMEGMLDSIGWDSPEVSMHMFKRVLTDLKQLDPWDQYQESKNDAWASEPSNQSESDTFNE